MFLKLMILILQCVYTHMTLTVYLGMSLYKYTCPDLHR